MDPMHTNPPPPSGGDEEATRSLSEKEQRALRSAIKDLERAVRYLCYREQLEDRASHALRTECCHTGREEERRYLKEARENRILAERAMHQRERELFRMLGLPELPE